MDRAEAIKELTQWRDQMKSHGVPNYGKKLTALDLAIEALLADTVHKPDYSYEAGMVRRLKEWQELDKAIQGDAESATTTDCISRQQAVEEVTKTIRDKFSFADWYEQLLETGLEIENLIKELPPVTPTVSEDCISREYMLKLQRELHGWMPNDKSHELWQKIKDAPSVTPTERTGKWRKEVNEKLGRCLRVVYVCSACGCAVGCEYFLRRSYCPNCGAKMMDGDTE